MNIPQAITSLEQQVECYHLLVKLSERQRMYIEQNQTDALVGVLEDRLKLMGEINRLEVSAGPFKKGWNELQGGLDVETRGRAEGLVMQTRELLGRITQADQDDVLILQQRKLNVGRQLQQAAGARAVNRTYAAAAGTPVRPASKLNVRS